MKRIGIYFFCVVALGCVTSSILYHGSEKLKEIRLEQQPLEKATLESEEESSVIENEGFENEGFENEKSEIQKIIEVSGENMPKERFLVIEEYGYLVVYDRLTMKQYDETTIQVQDLPEELQKSVVEGLYFLNEKALYAFLENYSS